MSIAHLKKKVGGLAKLQERLDSMKSKKSDSGEIYWKLSVDAAGNGAAEIRLLPEIESEDLPFQKITDYGISVFHKDIGKKKWYIHRSLECIGKKDPVKDEFWATMNAGEKELAKGLRDRTSYIVWIYIVNDKHAPENNGKVMKAKLSPSIWKFVESKIQPDEDAIEDGAKPTDVFDLWDGMNLKIRAKNGKNDMRTYENTHWGQQGPLFQDDDEIDKVFSNVKGLASEIDPTNPEYKLSYAELEAKLELVLNRPLYKNMDSDQVEASKSLSDQFDDGANDVSSEKEKPVNKKSETSAPKKQDISDDDDAELAKIIAEMED